jgi:pre-60S factor REI1
LKTKKHLKNVKVPRKNSNSTVDDPDLSSQKESQDGSTNAFDQNFVDKTLSENSKFDEPRKTAMDNLRICLFCSKQADGVKRNLDHMRVAHSFYVLDIDCLISLKAMLYYLAEKIQVGHLCINCNKNFGTGQAAQNHMLDMCHCCMNSEDFEDEYEYFYDFSGTYEEDFVGKTIDDFDLTEEPLAKPMSSEIANFTEDEEMDVEEAKAAIQTKLDKIPETNEDNEVVEVVEGDKVDDGDWEDVDVEDGQAESGM